MNARCQCGAIRFRIPTSKPIAVYVCHCDECRLQSSSAFGCSAIFPRFNLPFGKDKISVFTRSTASGHNLNCYFCKSCGTRLVHSVADKPVVSVKGGCIAGLDWTTAQHIWVKRALVPIPANAKQYPEEPDDEPDYEDITTMDDDGAGRGAASKENGGNGGGLLNKLRKKMSGSSIDGDLRGA